MSWNVQIGNGQGKNFEPNGNKFGILSSTQNRSESVRIRISFPQKSSSKTDESNIVKKNFETCVKRLFLKLLYFSMAIVYTIWIHNQGRSVSNILVKLYGLAFEIIAKIEEQAFLFV